MGRAGWALVTMLAAAGCASGQTLTINTAPQGATVTHFTGGVRGQTPAVFNYALTDAQRDKATGCYRVSGFSALWPSGAQAKTETVIPLCGAGANWTMTVNRPASAPNLELDLATERAVLAAMRAAEEEQRVRQGEAVATILGSFVAGAAEGWADSQGRRKSSSTAPEPPSRRKAITCRPSMVKDLSTGLPASYTCD